MTSVAKVRMLMGKVRRKLGWRIIDTTSTVDPTSALEAGTVLVNSEIGRHSFCGYQCTVLDTQIGSFCSIANDVSIGLAGRHPTHFVSTSPVFLSHKDSVKEKFSLHEFGETKRTTIGNDVWIGTGAMLRSGISVGHGAVIGMGSIVTKDVAPYAIVAGNPAKLVKYRFDEDVIEALLRLAWWDLPDHELRGIAKDFNDPSQMLSRRGLL